MKSQTIATRTVPLSRYSDKPSITLSLNRLGPLYQVKVNDTMSWHLSLPHAQAEFNRQALILEEVVYGD